MIYLSTFLFSGETVKNPNIYPYHVFANKSERLLLFNPITILYGNTAYFMNFVRECEFMLGEDEEGKRIDRLPLQSRYIKSEDIYMIF